MPSSLYKSPHQRDRQGSRPVMGLDLEKDEKLQQMEPDGALDLAQQQSSEKKTRNSGQGTGVRTPIFIKGSVDAKGRNQEPLSSTEQRNNSSDMQSNSHAMVSHPSGVLVAKI